MIHNPRQPVPVRFVIPFVLATMVFLWGCQGNQSQLPLHPDGADSPDAAVMRLLTGKGPATTPLPMAQTGSETVVHSLGEISFRDIYGNPVATFTVVGVEFLSTDYAKVYTTYLFTDPDLAGTRADITFIMALVEGVWVLDDFLFTKLPPVIVVGGLGVQGIITDFGTGQPVVNAAAGLYSGETLVDSTLTDSRGFYFLTAPSPGTYTVTVAKDGFEFVTKSVYLY